VECCFTLWLTSAPEPEPLKPVALALRQRLPGRLQRTARLLDRRLPGWPLRAANWFFRHPADSYADAIRCLDEETPSRLGLDLLLWSMLGHEDRSTCETRGRLAAMTASRLRRADDIVRDVLEVIDGYWQAGFASLWERQRAESNVAARLLRAGVERDLVAAVTALSPRAVYAADADTLSFVGGQGHAHVDCAHLEGLDIVPSLWLQRRVVLLLAPDRIGVSLPVASRRSPPLTEERILAMLGALAEPRRFAIVRLCASEALSTQEIASRLRVTEAPVSRHLKELERHGIVVGQRFGRQVTYTVVPESLAALGPALVGLLRRGNRGVEDQPASAKRLVAVETG
jgi:ArsR family transcriptional regulator